MTKTKQTTKQIEKLATSFDDFVANASREIYAAFTRGVNLVAYNEDPEVVDVATVAGWVSVITLSEAFSVTSEVVAFAIVAERNAARERAEAVRLPPTKADCDRRRAERLGSLPSRTAKPSDMLICDGCGKLARRDSFGADADLLCRCPACVAKSAKRVARRLAKGGR
jgi:superfamily I DNA/RNA helicase